MARPKQSEAFLLIKFFRDQPLEIAELTYALVRETMTERRAKIIVSTPMAQGIKTRKKRGPNKPKVNSMAAAPGPRMAVDYNPDRDN